MPACRTPCEAAPCGNFTIRCASHASDGTDALGIKAKLPELVYRPSTPRFS